MKTSYKLCKKCVVDTVGWNSIAEAWATKGCLLSDYRPIISCPYIIIEKYKEEIKSKIMDFIGSEIKDLYRIDVWLNYDAETHNERYLGRDFPQWCPYYEK